jgi:hypothetical protein
VRLRCGAEGKEFLLPTAGRRRRGMGREFLDVVVRVGAEVARWAGTRMSLRLLNGRRAFSSGPIHRESRHQKLPFRPITMKEGVT